MLSINGHEVRVTHPDKPYFTKQTKLSKLELQSEQTKQAVVVGDNRVLAVEEEHFGRAPRPKKVGDNIAGVAQHGEGDGELLRVRGDAFRIVLAVGVDGEELHVLAGVGPVQLGEADAALQLIELLLAMPAGREVSVPLLRLDPTFDPLRSDPRFEALLSRFSRN